ncbi:hypothetical protein INR49_003624 [Caranx melampygus]|nr:hypothetical protein INR49_003624 [Caranx melampygus]
MSRSSPQHTLWTASCQQHEKQPVQVPMSAASAHHCDLEHPKTTPSVFFFISIIIIIIIIIIMYSVSARCLTP